MPLLGLEVTAAFHDAAHVIRREARAAIEAGAPPDALEDVVRANLNALIERIAAIPMPCGQPFGLHGVFRVCEREAGHRGPHEGNL